MENRFLNGTMAGIVAGIVKDVPNGIFHIFPTLNALALWDYAGVLAFGRLSRNFGELLYALFLELLFGTFNGVIFIYLPFASEPGNYKLKGIFFGAIIWFLVRAVVLAFHISILLGENIGTSLTNLLLSMVFGCTLACIILKNEQKIN
ncbi:MAG TPA: hypothetical protein DDW50_09680 [Firmicutes bacterium]|nr:hypothetical protein [Bacillota bacterium]